MSATAWLAACPANVDPGARPDGGVRVDGGARIDGGAPGDSGEPPVSCARPAVPVNYNTLNGFTGSEDFQFDRDGNFVGVDREGTIVKIDKDGARRTPILPNAGAELSGLRYLPSGDLVYASVEDGTLYKVAPGGGRTALLSGLEYPNGVEVDLDGFIYVSEQNAGRVRRVDPSTGAFTIVAEQMLNPNGVAFGPEYKRLFVCSFGAGIIYEVHRDDAGDWSTLKEFARTPDAPGTIETGCESAQVGDDCMAFGAPGRCEDGGEEGNFCAPPKSPCNGRLEGDSCTVTSSTGANRTGHCVQWQSLRCEVPPPIDAAACTGKTQGDRCSFEHEGRSIRGGCESGLLGSGLVCVGGFSGAGGLDGLQVDACGNVYVTEFVKGVIWRITPDGQTIEQLVNLPTSWIPNMHWGSGVGGWSKDKLYVIDRAEAIDGNGGPMYELEVGIPGKRRHFP